MMTMKFIQSTFAIACLAILILDVTYVSCYRPSLLSTTRQSPPPKQQQQFTLGTPKTVTTTTTRRQWFNGIIAATAAAATSSMTADGNIPPANAVISSKYCAYGEGAGCEDLAEGNPLILELQQRSSKNKETIQRVRFKKSLFYLRLGCSSLTHGIDMIRFLTLFSNMISILLFCVCFFFFV